VRRGVVAFVALELTICPLAAAQTASTAKHNDQTDNFKTKSQRRRIIFPLAVPKHGSSGSQ
jgi:hypothetical protein